MRAEFHSSIYPCSLIQHTGFLDLKFMHFWPFFNGLHVERKTWSKTVQTIWHPASFTYYYPFILLGKGKTNKHAELTLKPMTFVKYNQ